MPHKILLPKLFTSLQDYSPSKFISDLTAGIIVGIIALPLAIAFAIASGVTPDKGLVTAIVAGFLISVLGGSRVQIGGPTGAFVVIVYGIVQQYGIDGLTIATMMAGALLIVMGFAGFGIAIKYIPYPVVVGFTSGIAVVIFSSQVKDFLGLSTGTVPADFVEKWKLYFENFHSFNWSAASVAVFTVMAISVWSKYVKKIPGSIAILILTILGTQMLNLPVETIGSRFGDLPHSLPMPHWPQINWEVLQHLIKPAFTIAMLAGIESLLSAEISDGMIGGRHRSNMELIAQGIANIASALFGGIPATGAIARTVTNIKNGGRTPVAGIVHAIVLLFIVFFVGPLVKLIPLAALAGILVIVSYHMSEWRSFLSILKGPRNGSVVLLSTFAITVLFDLTVAIEIGIVLSAILFMHRISKLTHVKIIDEEVEEEPAESISRLKVPSGIEIYEINGPLFFGASHRFEEAMRIVSKKPKVRILRLRNVPIVDATGLNSLKGFYEQCKQDGIALVISGTHVQPLNAIKKSGLYDLIGEKNFCGSIREAVQRAQDLKDQAV